MTQPLRVGDAIAAATAAVGVRPCGGCKRRQQALNRVFDPSAVSSGRSRSLDQPPALRARLAASLLVGTCAFTLRRRLN